MPKIYYRCSICHDRIKSFINKSGIRAICICPEHGQVQRIYSCQHNYWWELLYLTIKSYVRVFVNTLKIIRDSWRVFLQYERDYYKIEKILKEWSKK